MVSFAVINYAQDKTKMPNLPNESQRIQQEQNARKEVSKSIVANLFLDKLAVTESDWILTKGIHYGRVPLTSPAGTDVSFEKGANKVNITFSEFDSEHQAYDAYLTPRSAGAGVKLDGFGDEGEKIYAETGDFVSLHFRLGHIIVTISTRDEKTALRFAAYALDAVKNR